MLSDGVVSLRRLRPEDAPAYAQAFRDDPELGVLIGVETNPDEASVLEGIAEPAEPAENPEAVKFAIADARSDEFLGEMLVFRFNWRHRRCELGFWLAPGARRRGIGSRAVSLAISWAMDDLDLTRVEMTTTPENDAVPALARRLGFTEEGVLRSRNFERGRRVDVIFYGLLRDEWSQA